MHNSVQDRVIPLLVFFFSVAIFLTGPLSLYSAHGDELSGTWENDIYIVPSSTDGMIGSDRPLSTLSISYSTGGVTYSSESIFKKDEFYSQEFGLNYRMGILDLSSTASFDPTAISMNYWLNEGSFTLAGARFDTIFLLQQLPDSDEFGSGLQVTLSGNLAEGASASVISRFGMRENESQLLGLEPGSGYTIITSHGDQEDVYGPSQLQYYNSEIQLTGMVLDCCEYDVTTKFSEANGFEKTEFEFAIGGEDNPIGFEVDLKFTAQTKSVELDPSIVTEWGCFDVYTDLTTTAANDELGNNSTTASLIDGLQIKGYGISDVSLGHVTFSSLTALDGNLYKAPNTYNIDLRSYDYILEPPQEYITLFTETPYDQVFSLYKSGEDLNLTFGGDFYFDMSSDSAEMDSLFDVALITADGAYKLSDQFTMGAGFSIKPDSLERIRLSFDYSF